MYALSAEAGSVCRHCGTAKAVLSRRGVSGLRPGEKHRGDVPCAGVPTKNIAWGVFSSCMAW